MKKHSARFIASLSMSVLLGACGGEETSLKEIEQQIFAKSCGTIGCHAAANPSAGLVLAGSTYGNLVNVTSTQVQSKKRVLPSNPDASYLYEKIFANTPTVGGRMPLGSSPLSAAQIEMIRKWIAGGAPNN